MIYLKHHGIKGQKWGIKNGPPYPLVSKARVKNKINNHNTNFQRRHTDYNLNSWGRDKDHNILWITGVSGSGKSTLANQYAKKEKADVINIDLYVFKTPGAYKNQMSKQFVNFLNKKCPEWKQMQRNAYAVLTKTDRRGLGKEAAGKWFDTLEQMILDYGKSQFGHKKVIAEGVQISDETLFYNNKKALRDKPLIIMNTSLDESIISRVLRDNISLDKAFEPERIAQAKAFINGINNLTKEMTYPGLS